MGPNDEEEEEYKMILGGEITKTVLNKFIISVFFPTCQS